ncbi:distal tail protein Dit [Oceanobacillus kapialis]|uniref:Distal tail protein Dit n=1 Tax=Oceanobacillus kapialis TaxID=481353 RepID=A0ABW5PZD7_9BACI
MKGSFTFNSIRKEYIFCEDEGRTYSTAPVSRNLLSIPGFPGAHLINSDVGVLTIQQNVFFDSDSLTDFFSMKEEIAGWLLTDKICPLIFDDQPDRTYHAVIDGSIDIEELLLVGNITLTFICPDPYSYGPEQIIRLETILGNIVNIEGTAPTKPVFELNVLAPITFSMVSNGQEYMVIGKPADVTEEEVDDRTNVLHEEGSTLDTWSTTPVKVDENFSDIDGVMANDGSGIYVEDFGTGNKMHGPAMTKEITPVQDFELETIFDVITDDNEENFRMEVYMFDENFNMLGKFGINDNSRYLKRIRGLARVGEYVDRNTRYAIGSSNYERELGEVSLMFFRVKRVGNKYTFYISQIVNGDHQDTLTATYTDDSGEYLGRLRYVEIFIGKWQDRQRPFRARINNINVWQLAQTTVDQTPIIARIGDKITIDNQNKKLLLNGEPVVKGDFGSSPFSLKPGENKVVLLPENAVQGVMKYNPAFK